ncbi:hypothetical protein PG994_006791 [Apiospora phragmitis]|uniref:Uncharacterized protein n=1 Tax=Apiospora phragmitis TaxID=2905665 RepID=A0ABR1VIY2_9PEZI
MASCLPLNVFHRKPRPGYRAIADSPRYTSDSGHDDFRPFSDCTQRTLGTHGREPTNDLAFATVVYHIQAFPPASGERECNVLHNCDYIDTNERCVALPKPIPSFLVNLIVQDPTLQARTGQRASTLLSPCWKRLEDVVRDFTYVMEDPTTGKLVEARPGSSYQANIVVPQGMSSRLTKSADRDWSSILSEYATQGSGVKIEILVERGPDCI